jgi:hypothetical protein
MSSSETQTKTSYYETNIINEHIRVVSLSDIHGDIQSFIISLRDCAKVIKKKDEFNFDIAKYDDNMEQLLNINLNNDTGYKDDLNYEWCGDNTHVVICGDMIDPYRSNFSIYCVKDGGVACSYYPQIELKILMFINALNIQAKLCNGKIIKLFGNHEFSNIMANDMDGTDGYNYQYSYKSDQTNDYYKGVSRTEIFKPCQHGFDLLLEGGCGVLIKINNTIFVHGDLVSSYDRYNNLNQIINDPNKRYSLKDWQYAQFHSNSSLFNRERGSEVGANTRIINKDIYFCNQLNESFKKFIGTNNEICSDINDLILVIGHCPQNFSSIFDTQNTTYMDNKHNDEVMDVFGGNIYTGKSVFTIDRNKIFGITMECVKDKTDNKNENNLHSLYRIDIASSRGFDQYPILNRDNKSYLILPTNIEQENKYLYSKTPQILEIKSSGEINIIKSKMKNTRIHLPRMNYESIANNIDVLKLDNKESYHQKYLKYKNKYLLLKQIKK